MTPTRRRSSPTTGRAPPTTATSLAWTGPPWNPSRCSPPGTRASRSATPANAKEKTMPDISGLSWRTPFAFYDPDSSCWRTSQATFLSGSDEYSGTWPPSGMTRGGCAYGLPMWEHPTGGRGSLLLLKTPTAQLAVNGGSQHPNKRKAGGHGPTLADEVEHLLPTPRATRGGSATETTYLLPTPRATDGTKGGPNQRGSSGDLMLPSAVVQLLPTPLASDAGPRGGTTGFGLRDWSRAMAVGATTPPPSSGGNESSDGQLPLLPSPAAPGSPA
jgi:hypothetical protein